MFASCVLLHVLRVSVHARSISHYRSRATRSLSHSRLRRRCTSLDALDVHGLVGMREAITIVVVVVVVVVVVAAVVVVGVVVLVVVVVVVVVV